MPDKPPQAELATPAESAARAEAAASAIDKKAFRNALGEYTTGVTIITARDASGHLSGLTANSFVSVSLDPPLVLWSLSLYSGSLPLFQTVSHYAINVLAQDQLEISKRFATSGIDKFTGINFIEGAGSAPVLPGSCASFECRNEITHAGGDHVIFIGLVEKFTRIEGKAPLVFQGGRYRSIKDV